MKKFAVAAALLTAIVATPAMAAEGGEGRVEVRGGLITLRELLNSGTGRL